MTRAYLSTGQVTCHDARGDAVPCAGSGQDAEFGCGLPWPQRRFAPQGECVEDRLTGLIWPRDAALSEFPLTWKEALDFVVQYNRDGTLGHTDWRLPNRRELRSLISHQTRRPALPEAHPFRNVFSGWYWSATTAVISPAHAWYVDLDGGRMFYGGKDQSFMVWPVCGDSAALPRTGQTDCYAVDGKALACVDSGQDGALRRGRAWPSPRFEPWGGHGTLDRLTGLVWQRNPGALGAGVPWAEGLERIRQLPPPAPGCIWRLPNINELESLVDCSRHSPALPSGHGFEGLEEVYWSSSSSLYEPDWAWALYLHKGAVGVGQKQHARFHAWAVTEPA